MVTLRFPVRPLLEWALAAAVTAALVLAVAVCVREARTIQAAVPAGPPSAPLVPPGVPAVIPPGAVSVPLLLLPRHVTLRVGDTAAAVADMLEGRAELTAEVRDRVKRRERVTRAYTATGMRFFLVFEAGDEREDARLTAIYLS